MVALLSLKVVQWLARWTSALKIAGSRPSPCHGVVSLLKKLCPTLSLSIQVQVYKWVQVTYCWE